MLQHCVHWHLELGMVGQIFCIKHIFCNASAVTALAATLAVWALPCCWCSEQEICCRKSETLCVSCADVFKKFESSAWGKKLAKREAKANATDFERYQAAVARKKRSEAVKKALKA